MLIGEWTKLLLLQRQTGLYSGHRFLPKQQPYGIFGHFCDSVLFRGRVAMALFGGIGIVPLASSWPFPSIMLPSFYQKR
jgi:hypothetical protein